MAAVVLEIRRRKYVCGLFWQSLSRPRELKTEAIELARKLNFDLMVLRKDLGVAQVGFASTKEGVHHGMLSLGAIVASTVAAKGISHDGRRQSATSWLAAFRLDNERWAYFAVRDESFLPQGDFCGSKADVLERLYADYGLGGWNAVIGEPELSDQGFHDFNPATIDDFLPPGSSRRLWLASAWELVPVQRTRQIALAAAGVGAVAVAAGAATWWWRQHQAEQALDREQAMMTAQQRIAADQARQPIPPPWLGKASPREFARACGEHDVLLAPGGWKLDELVCSQSSFNYSWSRAESTVANLLQHVPRANVDLSGDKARYAQPVSMPTTTAEDLLPAEQLLMPLVSRFQELGLKLALKPPAAPPAPPALPGMRPPPAPDWKTYTFTLPLQGLPLAEAGAVLTQPGVRLSTLTYRQGEWFVEGMVYAK